MPRKAHKYHYIYKTTCNVTEKFYIGMHSCSNLEDGYLGSGKRLRYSVNKYGAENHTKVILEFLPDRKSLAERERELVDQEMLNENLCMNLQLGGGGGFSDTARKLGTKNMLEKMWKDPDYVQRKKEKASATLKKLYNEGKLRHDGFLGKTHTKETIKIMKDKKIGHGLGSTNSQYDKRWITNGIESKKIYKGEDIPEGWRLGRILK